MTHYLNHFASSVKKYWDSPMFTNFGANTLTYGDVACGIEKYHILFSECGIKKGDKIALCARNSAEWGMAFMAIVTYDAVIVPLLPDFLPKSVVELSCFADSKMLIADATCYNGFKDDKEAVAIMRDKGDFLGVLDVKDMKLFVSFSDTFKGAVEGWDAMFAQKYPGGVKPEMIDYRKSDDILDNLALISFTSGTTSSPKGVMLPARSISVNLEFALREIPLKPGGHILSVLPLAHMFGLTFDFLFPMAGGCHITILGAKPTPAKMLAAFAVVKPFMFLTVPLVLEKIFRSKVIPTLRKPAMRVMLSIPGIRQFLLSKVRAKLLATFGGELTQGFLIGGAALNKEVENAMRMIGIPYSVGYGMTECGPLISYCDKSIFAAGSCGRPARPIEVRIDSPRPSKILGEIQVKGPFVMQGYYKNEEATKAVFTSDGWLKTGDMGIMDVKENIFIKGRCKNMILTASGQNVYPEEIEDKLNSIPYVIESLAVGRKNSIIALLVVDWAAAKSAGISEDALKAQLREEVMKMNEQLPAYSRINDCDFRIEPFEKTPKQSIKRFMYQ
ncbi:MAG: long-chain fatty acid--CoA ligase [Bacteroidales bacterium]|nr:long-chain fatty acid--CoA ligase [Bacteroidales bacterium]